MSDAAEIAALKKRLQVLEEEASRLKEAEEALRLSEKRLRQIIDLVPHFIFAKDIHGRFILVNQAVADAYGTTVEELTGKGDADFDDSDEEVRHFRADDLEVIQSGKPKIIPDETITDASGAVRRLTTVKIPFTFSGSSAPAMLGVSVDITERKRAEELRAESERRYRAVFNSMYQFIGLLAVDGTVLEINDTALEAGGLRLADAVGKPFWETGWWAGSAATRTRVRESIGRAARGELIRYEAEVLGAGGRIIPIDFSLKPILDEQGHVTHIIPEGRDITDRRRAEEERLDIQRRIQETQKLESLGVLAGGIAHDFNNLLTVIMGNAALAEEDVPPANPAAHSIREIERAARRATELCSQLLAYSGRGRFVTETVDIGELVRDMVHLLKTSVSKKATLDLQIAPRIPAVRGDATQLRQIVMNLVINASESLGDQGGVITLSTGVTACSTAFLQAKREGAGLPPGDYVWIEVADTGCGMPPETQRRIFEPFFTTKFTGRGLGLSALLGIVRGHRGAIEFRSRPGAGTTFRVWLPAADGAAEPERRDTAPAPSWKGTGTVLLVDDEPGILETGAQMLRRLGFHVLTASDGMEAVEIYRQQRAGIVLVLLDLTMPRLSGDETLRELRRIDPDVRVVMSSGYSGSEVTLRLEHEGLAGFVQKPYSLAEMRECLRAALPAQRP